MIEFLGILLAAAMGFVGLFLANIARLVVFAIAAISAVFMIGALFSFAIWALTGQHAAFLSMLDFLVWGSLSFVPMALIQYYMDKLVNPDPQKMRWVRIGEAPGEPLIATSCRSRSTGPVMPLRQQVPVWLAPASSGGRVSHVKLQEGVDKLL
jgi:hypothetical protein